MPSLATQSDAELGGALSVLVRQKRDHERLDRLLDLLADASTGRDQDAVLNRIGRLVFPHAFAEESVLWPELRRVLPDGDELTRQVEEEHQEVNELWSRLETGHLAAVERQQVLNRLVDVLREDVRHEEDRLLPRLQEAVEVRRLHQLGLAWEAVRRIAPTRPHPIVSRRPPGNALAALPLILLDRTRDGIDVAARRYPTRLGPSLVQASGGLARAAGRVERLGVLRRGERSTTRRA